MAKSQEDPLVLEQALITASSPPGASTLTFRDKVYTSRILILPENRQLVVAKGAVTVSTSDSTALKYLNDNAEFEQLKE